MNVQNGTFLLRAATALILLIHSIPGMFNNGINDFGNLFLNQIGLAPFGLVIAWAVKLSHIVCAWCFLFEKYVKWAGIITLFVLVMGIALVHLKEGWFVVGGGRNGVEFNLLLIVVILTIMFPSGIIKRNA